MLAFGFSQHQGLRDALKHCDRRRAATALFEPRVPRGADVGPHSDFLAPQARRAPTLQWKAESRRIKPRAAIFQKRTEWMAGGNWHGDRVVHYTRVMFQL